jgi:hypothetical protein
LCFSSSRRERELQRLLRVLGRLGDLRGNRRVVRLDRLYVRLEARHLLAQGLVVGALVVELALLGLVQGVDLAVLALGGAEAALEILDLAVAVLDVLVSFRLKRGVLLFPVRVVLEIRPGEAHEGAGQNEVQDNEDASDRAHLAWFLLITAQVHALRAPARPPFPVELRGIGIGRIDTRRQHYEVLVGRGLSGSCQTLAGDTQRSS